MKYFVVATQWDNERKAQVKYIAGQFDSFVNASIFQKAYNEKFCTSSKIVDAHDLINGIEEAN